jgi:hypothetical protein
VAKAEAAAAAAGAAATEEEETEADAEAGASYGLHASTASFHAGVLAASMQGKPAEEGAAVCNRL